MREVAKLPVKDRTELFQATAIKMGMLPNVVEKDFWVCFMLDHLFHDCQYKKAFVFKGGTSLSKSYHVIERFSEDIDLILDWRKIITDEGNPWSERSKTKQDQFNKQINAEAAKFYENEFVPKLNKELEKKLGDGEWVAVDSEDEMVVNFYYPQIFESEYLRSCVRLEIGPLAEWMPSHETVVSPFAAEKYPDVFTQKETSVLTIDVERTFWEKLTILHKIANFPEGKVLPARYARHLYDVYNLGNSWVKESAFARKELLEKDVAFKQKFYYTKSAHYETATLNSIELMPSDGSCDYDPSKYNCRNVRMKTEEFEAGVMQYINTTAAGMLEHLQIYKKKRSSSVELQKEIDKLHQMKSKAEAKKFQLYDDYTKGIVQRDIMVSERTTLTERIGEIEIELHELESKIQLEQCINKAGEEETIELLSKMETFDLDLIRQVVKRITMYDDGNIQFEWNVDDFLQVK